MQFQHDKTKSWNKKNSDGLSDNSIFIQQLRFVFMQALGDFATQGWCRFHQGLAQGWNGVLTLDHNQNMEKLQKPSETWYLLQSDKQFSELDIYWNWNFWGAAVCCSRRTEVSQQNLQSHHILEVGPFCRALDRLLTLETDRNDSVDVHRPAMSCLDHANKAHRLLRCFHPLREILACAE